MRIKWHISRATKQVSPARTPYSMHRGLDINVRGCPVSLVGKTESGCAFDRTSRRCIRAVSPRTPYCPRQSLWINVRGCPAPLFGNRESGCKSFAHLKGNYETSATRIPLFHAYAPPQQPKAILGHAGRVYGAGMDIICTSQR
jgi:hypothetical protein